jgi:hypothetical protein
MVVPRALRANYDRQPGWMRHHWRCAPASTANSIMHMMMRRRMRLTRYRLFLLLAFVKALHNRRSPWYQRGLIRKPLRKIGVILLHDIEHCFLGKPAMVLGY